jgi:hypothetical protein
MYPKLAVALIAILIRLQGFYAGAPVDVFPDKDFIGLEFPSQVEKFRRLEGKIQCYLIAQIPQAYLEQKGFEAELLVIRAAKRFEKLPIGKWDYHMVCYCKPYVIDPMLGVVETKDRYLERFGQVLVVPISKTKLKDFIYPVRMFKRHPLNSVRLP